MKAFGDKVVWLRLDVAADEPTAVRYGLLGVPTVKILGPDGAVLETVEDLTAEGILAALKRHAK